MQTDTRRPVRKCSKCKLNFSVHCGLYENPRDMWKRHRVCPGYLNEAMYREYQQRQQKLIQRIGSRPLDALRRQIAKARQTVAHSDGMHTVKPRVIH